MRRTLSVALIVFTVLCTSAAGFDGHRKGFVVGGGVGFSPYGHWSVDKIYPHESVGVIDASSHEDRTTWGGHFIIGYGWDERNVLVYEANVILYHSDLLDQSIDFGINSVSWYHYYGKYGKSLFSIVGLGYYSFESDDFEQTHYNGSILIGGGYSFLRHWQVGGYWATGKASSGPIDFNISHISILVSLIAF